MLCKYIHIHTTQEIIHIIIYYVLAQIFAAYGEIENLSQSHSENIICAVVSCLCDADTENYLSSCRIAHTCDEEGGLLFHRTYLTYTHDTHRVCEVHFRSARGRPQAILLLIYPKSHVQSGVRAISSVCFVYSLNFLFCLQNGASPAHTRE